MKVSELIPDMYGIEESVEFGEIYRVDAGKLVEILKKLSSRNESSSERRVYLRRKGIEIWGGLTNDCGSIRKSYISGMIVSGAHLNKMPTEIYLVTLEPKPKEGQSFISKGKLVDLLREYIVYSLTSW